MEKLRKFETENDFKNVDLFYPNVSLTKDNEKVWIKEKQHYEWIDLGLPSGTLWADRCVGAKEKDTYGLSFRWGETKGYITTYDYTNDKLTIFDTNGNVIDNFNNYKFYDYDKNVMTKYNETDGLTTLLLQDDIAYLSNHECRMPTKEEVEELMNFDYTYPISSSSVFDENNNPIYNYYIIKSRINENEIHIPCVDYEPQGSYRAYYIWTSTLLTESNDINNNYNNEEYYNFAYTGCWIGAVGGGITNVALGRGSLRPILPVKRK